VVADAMAREISDRPSAAIKIRLIGSSIICRRICKIGIIDCCIGISRSGSKPTSGERHPLSKAVAVGNGIAEIGRRVAIRATTVIVDAFDDNLRTELRQSAGRRQDQRQARSNKQYKIEWHEKLPRKMQTGRKSMYCLETRNQP
jgi:hypothetical protein